MVANNNNSLEGLAIDKIAIRVTNVNKVHEIYARPENKIKQSVLPKIQRLFGLQPKKYFSAFEALKDISFEVRKGETLGIVGRNGAGKSTLLQIICGTLSPTSGEITINGRVAALLELGSGFNPEFTGKENIYLNAAVLGLKKEEIDKKYSMIEEFSEIGEFINQPIKTYSSGMVMRLAFSVAIHSDPNILIIDEALAVGDFYFQQKCFQRLFDLKKSGVALIFVSHDSGSVVQLSDTAIFLSDGELKFKGTPKDTVNTYLASLHLPKVGSLIENDNVDALNDFHTFYEINANAQIYGSGHIEIIDWAIFDGRTSGPITVIQNDKEVTIFIKARFIKNCHDPIFGYFFTDAMGRQIVGTNSKYLKSNFGIRKTGEILEIKFTQTFHLAAGEYSLNIGCSEFTNEGLVAHHRLYDLSVVRFLSNNECVGFYLPETELAIREISSDD